MGDHGIHVQRPFGFYRLGRLDKRTCGGDHVVDYHDVLPLYISHHVHDLRAPVVDAPLVHDGEARPETLGVRPRGLDPAHVRRYDDEFLQFYGFDVVREDLDGEEVVERYVEEPLDLAGVQVYRQYPVRACCGQEVRDEFRRSRDPRLVLPVLPGVTEIRQDRRYPLGRGPPEGGYQYKEFHKGVIGWGGDRE